MKKVYTYAMMALMMALTMTTFTSCDKDAMEARTLNGGWTGYIDTYYYDRWGVSGESFRTTMYFDRIDRYGGSGYEVDYDIRSPYSDYYYCPFDWEIYNGVIRIRYADSWNDVLIYNYHLDYDYFEGYMDDGVSANRIHFTLYYDDSFNWGRYWNMRSVTDSNGVKANGIFAKSKGIKE